MQGQNKLFCFSKIVVDSWFPSKFHFQDIISIFHLFIDIHKFTNKSGSEQVIEDKFTYCGSWFIRLDMLNSGIIC